MGVNVPARFSVSAGAVILAAAACCFGAVQLLVLVFIAAVAHELGHYFALRFCGGSLTEIRLSVTGVTMRHNAPATYMGEILTAASGPAASAALSAAAACAARLMESAFAYRLAGVSLLFCLFNMLPFFPLDGGRILYAAVARAFGLLAADRVSCIASCTVIFFVLCAGTYVLAVTGMNFTLLLTAVWMLIHYCKNGNNSIKSH